MTLIIWMQLLHVNYFLQFLYLFIHYQFSCDLLIYLSPVVRIHIRQNMKIAIEFNIVDLV